MFEKLQARQEQRQEERKSQQQQKEEVTPTAIGGPCQFMLGSGLGCLRPITSGVFCQRHNLIVFGTTAPIGDLLHEKIGRMS